MILNENDEYEILDGSYQRIASLKTVPFDTEEAFKIVMNFLQHLAMFKYFEAVENRTLNQFFEVSFKFSSIDNTELINTKHEKK